MESSAKSSKKVFWVVLLLAVVFLVALGGYLWQNGFSLPILGSGSSFQAVFLSNGQVYFGKLSDLNSNFPRLTDIYYLQVNQVLQPVQGQKTPQPTQQLSLVKLGTVELHRPDDLMKINKDHIIFVENLVDESQVVQAIKRYKDGQTTQ